MSAFLSTVMMEVLVAIAAAGAVGAFSTGIVTWLRTRQHDRDLYGDDRTDRRGLVERARRNTERSQRNERALDRADMLGGDD